MAVHVARALGMPKRSDRALLPETDWEQALRIGNPKGRFEFLTARGLLRRLLAAEWGAAAATAPILQDPFHKPHLAIEGLEFSLAHATGWCAVALSRDYPVGIDAEPIRLLPRMEDVVMEFFPLEARADFQVAESWAQPDVFFYWWARIEAALKARGIGLDSARSCFDDVYVESCQRIPGLALAVAAISPGPLRVKWHLPPRRQRQVGSPLAA